MSEGKNHVCRIETVMIEDRAILVDAQHLNRPSVLYTNVPLLSDFSGIMAVPKPGQRCVISKDSSGFEYVDGLLAGPEDPVADLKESEFVMQFDPETKIAFSKGDSGYDVSIEASGDVSVKAGGDIRIGENGEKVAKQNHTHEYVGGGKNSSTGTSSTPLEDGTETTIK